MAQWTDLQRIEKFVNPDATVRIACEKSGGLHLVEPGLTAGSLVVRQFGRRNFGKA